MIFPIIVLLIVFLLIAIRQIGRFKLRIWQIMLGGALGVLFTGQISPANAIKAVNLDVMVFLFSMFFLGAALEESGYLSHLSYKLFRHAKSLDTLLLAILFGTGIASAFLMNDTLAIIGTPVMLFFARKHKIPAKMLLLALAFAVTIGSVMSPIGNPQNLLIALQGNIPNPFVAFAKYLLIPTLLNLLIAFLMLRLFYKKQFIRAEIHHTKEPLKDPAMALLAKTSLLILIILIAIKIGGVFLQLPYDLRLTAIAAIAVLPLLLFCRKRLLLMKKVDWHTLVFFAAMFVLMQSVWDTGFFQTGISMLHINISSIPAIIFLSVAVSQFISNVPLVALYLPLLSHAGAGIKEMVALAAGSTIAGNLLILGAASNVIIIQNAEKKAEESISFWEFAKVGIPLTLLNIAVYAAAFAIF
ncbi:anion transporter [Candidatus Woesearchaeota archaeon]|nr:anion transporter [Candidatus Woesearchaeota archaeon]